MSHPQWEGQILICSCTLLYHHYSTEPIGRCFVILLISFSKPTVRLFCLPFHRLRRAFLSSVLVFSVETVFPVFSFLLCDHAGGLTQLWGFMLFLPPFDL